MNTNTFLETYIGIESNSTAKKEREHNLDQLLTSLQVNYSMFTTDEVISITRQLLHLKINIRQPLFANLIYPVLKKEVESGNIEAIKLFIRLDRQLTSYYSYTNDYPYSTFKLLEKGLEIAPDDHELLETYVDKIRQYINYTLHELPAGVLYGIHAATAAECMELINMIGEYQKACSKLNLEEGALIEKAQFYYTRYNDYLQVISISGSFQNYLAALEK